jgi:plastocyanin
MNHRAIVPALAIGILLAASAWGQHHHPMDMSSGAKVDYEPTPGGGDPNPPQGCSGVDAKFTINETTMTFSPPTLTVDAGQPVCWTWSGTSVAHNIKADDGSFTSGAPSDRATFQRTFNSPGSFGFHCQVHGAPTGGMHGVVIVRDTGAGSGDGPGTLQVSSTSYTVGEGDGTLTIRIERVGGSDGTASVKYGTANGSAKGGKDFTPRKGTVSWANGDAGAKTVEIPIRNDGAQEPDKTFAFKLSGAKGARLGAAAATVTIHDDDGGGCAAAVLAPSDLRAMGQSSGEIRLTWSEEADTAGMVRVERRTAGGAFREIAKVPAGVESFTDSGLPAGATFQYRVRVEGTGGASAVSSVVAGATDGSTAACDDGRALCLLGGRFEATVEWGGAEAKALRDAKRVALPETPGAALFFSPGEDEPLLLKVTDGCDANGHFGIDLASALDAGVTVKVRDTRTGRTWVYANPDGAAPGTMRDAEAFATCP